MPLSGLCEGLLKYPAGGPLNIYIGEPDYTLILGYYGFHILYGRQKANSRTLTLPGAGTGDEIGEGPPPAGSDS